MWNYPIKNCIELHKHLSQSIDNYQRMFGINVEVYRLDNREGDNTVLAYGGFHAVKSQFRSKIFDIGLLCTPMELYEAYSTASGNGELDVYTRCESLKLGDIIKYEWTDGNILEFEVMSIPKTMGETYYQYRIKSMYQTNSSKKN